MILNFIKNYKMRYLVERDRKLRINFGKNYKNYIITKCVYLYLKKEIDKYVFLNDFQTSLKKFSITKVKRYCLFTNRSKSVYRHFRLSRLGLHSLFRSRLVNGLRYINW